MFFSALTVTNATNEDCFLLAFLIEAVIESLISSTALNCCVLILFLRQQTFESKIVLFRTNGGLITLGFHKVLKYK